MSELAPNTLSILDKLTDPLPPALADTREALEHLINLLAKLTAGKAKFEDEGDDVWYLASELEDAFDVLAAEVERRL